MQASELAARPGAATVTPGETENAHAPRSWVDELAHAASDPNFARCCTVRGIVVDVRESLEIVIDDGSGALTARYPFGDETRESLTDRLVAQPVEVRGTVRATAYGLIMEADRFLILRVDAPTPPNLGGVKGWVKDAAPMPPGFRVEVPDLGAQTPTLETPAEPPKPTPEPFEASGDLKDWKSFVGIAGALSDEGLVTIASGKLQTELVDPAHVAYVNLRWTRGVDTYNTKGERLVGMDFEKFGGAFKALKPSKDGPKTAKIVFDETVATLTLGNSSRTLGLVDASGFTKPKMPTFTNPGFTWDMDRETLAVILKTASLVSDHLTITAGDGVSYDAAGDTEKTHEKTDPYLKAERGAQKGETHRSVYSLDYLRAFIGALPKAANLTLKMGTDYPLSVDFYTETLEGTYLLAPRIESDS